MQSSIAVSFYFENHTIDESINALDEMHLIDFFRAIDISMILNIDHG